MSLSEGLAALGAESEATEHAKVGYSHLHKLGIDSLLSMAALYREHAYILEQITCQDRREDLEKMRLVYQFNSLSVQDRHLLHVDIDSGESAPTLCGVYKAADWMEREVYDMYGVEFEGHPNPKRILLPEDAEFFALLKDFGRMEDAPEPDAPAAKG